MKTSVMPNVLYCSVHECAYNDKEKCHAGAITVDGPEPLCDTYFTSDRKGGIKSQGAVGACKNGLCVHNNAYECTAESIQVSLRMGKPECDTFALASPGRATEIEP